MRSPIKLLVLTWFMLPLACAKTQKQPQQPLSYLALGDSYTIGESVAEAERWPVILAHELTEKGLSVQAPQIIATTGWTTDELLAGMEKTSLDESYDMVSLLIGVNNQYRSYPIETYKAEFAVLLEKAIALAQGDPKRVFVLSIPDYGATPFGQAGNPQKIGEEIDYYNGINKEISESFEVQWFDITPISRDESDPGLIASDKLHPSGKMYRAWVDHIIDPLLSHLQKVIH